ncbi:hypothetical protein B0D71_00570 [Pseudomonas laurylsulfativorans]|uniref:Uncharacterized protein n=1 Tax=Pseudomonas laurylsulfativorans TaxID=1943631 RepID=A0A2S3VTS9_9PSED|nr:hypothetical protein B0D71_00570 [Pseudomonas laurylsulfativorans]
MSKYTRTFSTPDLSSEANPAIVSPAVPEARFTIFGIVSEVSCGGVTSAVELMKLMLVFTPMLASSLGE